MSKFRKLAGDGTSSGSTILKFTRKFRPRYSDLEEDGGSNVGCTSVILRGEAFVLITIKRQRGKAGCTDSDGSLGFDRLNGTAFARSILEMRWAVPGLASHPKGPPPQGGPPPWSLRGPRAPNSQAEA